MTALTLAASAATPALANQFDPYAGSWFWPRDYQGTYRYGASFYNADGTERYPWMSAAIYNATDTMGHRDARSPDFDPTSRYDSGANGKVSLLSRAGQPCNGVPVWYACATYSPAHLTWTLWFATEECWRNDSKWTCTDSPRYDVETVALNEMGHVNTLAHHVPATSHEQQGSETYLDAVVQAVPDPYSHPYGVRREVGWADDGALHARYFDDIGGCWPPPCPEAADT